MINFALVNVTGDLMIRKDKFPENFAQNSRSCSLKQLSKALNTIERIEVEIAAHYKLTIKTDSITRQQKILRDGRIELTNRGIYDAVIIRVL